MVKRLSLPFADRLAVGRAAGEHQGGAVGGVRGEAREHRPLIPAREMEEAVPGEEAVESAVKFEPTHVRDDPLFLREALAAQVDQSGRRIDARHAQAGPEEIARDRLAGTAAQVEHPAARRQASHEGVQPGFLEERAAPLTIPD